MDSSDESDEDQRDRHHRRSQAAHDSRTKQRESLAAGDHEHDYGQVVKEVELKEFRKICLRRRELCKWIENPEF